MLDSTDSLEKSRIEWFLYPPGFQSQQLLRVILFFWKLYLGHGQYGRSMNLFSITKLKSWTAVLPKALFFPFMLCAPLPFVLTES